MLLVQYLYWHYLVAPGGIVRILKNYMTGTWHRFLIKRHLATLFAPWHRALPSDLPEKRTLEVKLTTPIIDLVIRFFAAFVRMSIILTGLAWQFFYLAGFGIFLVVWLLWPLVVLTSISIGLKFL